MKRLTAAIICALAPVCVVASAQNGADWEARGKRWWAHVQFLADDKLKGRDTGSAGFEKAAEYVAEQFEKAGLKASGVKGYRQRVEAPRSWTKRIRRWNSCGTEKRTQ